MWLVQNSTNPALTRLLPELTVMMLHVVDAVEQLHVLIQVLQDSLVTSYSIYVA